MMRKVFICLAGVYIYLILVVVQVDWFIGRAADFAIEKEAGYSRNEGLFLRHRRLTEFEYPEAFQSTTKGLELETGNGNCETQLLDECPLKCKNWNSSFRVKSVRSDFFRVSQQNGNNSRSCDLQSAVKNCSLFKNLYKYDFVPTTHEERSFPLAFGLKMHHHPEVAEQILRAIYRKHNVYCIHVDRRAEEDTFEVIDNIGKCLKNVIVVEDREYMIHASHSHVISDIKCMQAVMKSKISWKYYINLSGQEFPLKTNLEMIAILYLFQGTNDIETFDHPVDQNWKIENKFSVFGNSLAQELRKPQLKYNLKISKGNPFGMFSRDFVEFVFEDDVAQYLMNYFKDTYAPEENIWATLVTLPWAPGGYPVEVRHMISTYVSRAMIFTGDSQPCYGRYVRGYCQFSCGDLPWLQNRPEFFASKLDIEQDKYTLNCLFDWYKTKAERPQLHHINWAFYSRLPHVKYHRQHKYSLQSKADKEKIKKEWLINNTRDL